MPPMRLVAMLPAPMNPIRGAVISLFLCCGSGVVAGAEQRGADTHQGRALGDGLVQIVAHAHGQGVQRQLESSHGLAQGRSEEHTSELQSRPHLVCRLLLEKKKKKTK